MDPTTTAKIDNEQLLAALDDAIEAEVKKGYRVLDVPDVLVAELLADQKIDATKPVYRKLRLVKMTGERRGLVSKFRSKVFFRAMEDESVLSMDQVRNMSIKRGVTVPKDEAEIKALQESTAHQVARIFQHGLDETEWADELRSETQRFSDWLERRNEQDEYLIPENRRLELLAAFARWQAFDPLSQERYDELYGNGSKYDVEADREVLMQGVGSVEMVDALSRIEEIRDRMNDLRLYMRDRLKLAELQLKYAKMYANTVEQMSEEAEEYAKIYYTTQVMDQGRPQPLTKTVDELYALAPGFLEWLTTEVYLFLNAIPPETEAYLRKLGFLGAPLRTLSAPASDASPEEPASSPDTTPPAETLATSTA